MKLIFYNSLALLFMTDIVFLIGLIPTDGKTNNKNFFNLTIKRKVSFLLPFFQDGTICVKRSSRFLYLLGSLWLLRCPIICWKYSTSNTDCSGLVFMVSDWHPQLITIELVIVFGGEIPAFGILQYVASWSVGPPRMEIIKRKRKKGLRLLLLLHSAICRALCPGTLSLLH